MIKGARSTVRVFGVNQRASPETQLLFAGLEAFANLGDSFDEYLAFTTAHTTFWPVEFQNNSHDALGWGQDADFYVLTIMFRDCLRRVWRGDRGQDHGQIIKILLGLELETVGPERHRYAIPLELVHDRHPDFGHTLAVINADWLRGEFCYAPLNDFQRAVYALWRESWRARICPQCERLFIAAKAPQLYCSPQCSTVARRKRDLVLWRARGTRGAGNAADLYARREGSDGDI